MEVQIDIEKQREYIARIDYVVVRYADKSKRRFTAAEWFLFEDQVTAMNNISYTIYEKGRFPLLLSEMVLIPFLGPLFYNLPETLSQFFDERLWLFILVLTLSLWTIFTRYANYRLKVK